MNIHQTNQTAPKHKVNFQGGFAKSKSFFGVKRVVGEDPFFGDTILYTTAMSLSRKPVTKTSPKTSNNKNVLKLCCKKHD